MALIYDCTTELEAVNSILEMAGEMRVNELTDTGVSEALIAWKTLHRYNRSVQKNGLNCNTEEEYRFTPDVNGFIWLPLNTLAVTNVKDTNTIFIRDGKLYDTYKKTFKFTKPVVCDLVLFLEYKALPEHVREYVMMLAARRFISNVVGAKDLLEQTDEDLFRARRDFKRYEIKNQKNNILGNSESFYILRRT